MRVIERTADLQREVAERRRAEEAAQTAAQLAESHVEVIMRSLDVLTTEAAPEKFFGEMLRTIGQHLRANRVMLWLRNPQDDSLRLHVVIQDDQQIPAEPDAPLLSTPQAWKKKPSCSRDARH